MGRRSMKFLLLNQTFHPDLMATAQYLSDLAAALAERGHEVQVVASRRAYDDPAQLFPKAETWRGVCIHRIATTAFGKTAKWRRAADFASFIVTCCWRLLFTPKPDVMVALTSPPLISFIGALYARLRGARFAYWVMDLNPDEAIAAGWLREGSLAARFFHALSRHSFRRADRIIVLDRFMRDRIIAKGIAPGKILVLPPWSHDDTVRFDPAGRERFRAAHGLTDRFVIMYSGNHSPCHPLDTLIAATAELSGDSRFAFLFVGGGSEWRKISTLVPGSPSFTRPKPLSHSEGQAPRSPSSAQPEPPPSASTVSDGPPSSNSELLPPHSAASNLLCLPYQPFDQLAASLSAADLHVVVMGDTFVGIIHPCKIYNLLGVAAPVLCITPTPSHLTEILTSLNSAVCRTVAHGNVAGCVAAIREISALSRRGEPERYAVASAQFGFARLLPTLITELEAL